MKQNYLLYLLCSSIFVLSSCVDEYWEGDEFNFVTTRHYLYIDDVYGDVDVDANGGFSYNSKKVRLFDYVGKKEINIVINTDGTTTSWKLSGLPEWITASNTSGNTSETIHLIVSETNIYRTADLEITSSDIPGNWQLLVEQYGPTPHLVFSTYDVEFSSKESNCTITCDANCAWFVKTDASWIKPQKLSDNELLISVEENTTRETRQDYINVVFYDSFGAERSQSISVKQSYY